MGMSCRSPNSRTVLKKGKIKEDHFLALEITGRPQFKFKFKKKIYIIFERRRRKNENLEQ